MLRKSTRGLYPRHPCKNCGASTMVRPSSECRSCTEAARRERKRLNGFEQRFYSHVPVVVGDECAEWTGTRLLSGYGTIIREKRILLAHRVAVELATGQPIPKGMWVCHKCDNPPCVRPDHLFIGTAKEDMQDAASKGRLGAQRDPESYRRRLQSPEHRAKSLRGDAHPNAILTSAAVREIRTLHAQGGISGAELGRRYGVSKHAIYSVIHREWWREVE